MVRVHPRGEACWSLWRWHDGENWVGDWYGNLESPWRRSAVGYDTQDWALDVVGEGSRALKGLAVRFKDEDELDWYVEQGAFSPSVPPTSGPSATSSRSCSAVGAGSSAPTGPRGFRPAICRPCRSRRVGSTSRTEPCDMMSWCRRRHLARHPDHRRSHGPLARPHQGAAHLVRVPDHGAVRRARLGPVGRAHREHLRGGGLDLLELPGQLAAHGFRAPSCATSTCRAPMPPTSPRCALPSMPRAWTSSASSWTTGT